MSILQQWEIGKNLQGYRNRKVWSHFPRAASWLSPRVELCISPTVAFKAKVPWTGWGILPKCVYSLISIDEWFVSLICEVGLNTGNVLIRSQSLAAAPGPCTAQTRALNGARQSSAPCWNLQNWNRNSNLTMFTISVSGNCIVKIMIKS